MPLRNAQAQLAVLPAYADREELGEIQAAASASFNPDRLELIAAAEQLSAELSGIPDPIERNEEEKGISLRELSGVLKAASDTGAEAFAAQRAHWFERLLGSEREEVPSSFHTAYMRRLSPLESTYTKERATEICLATLTELGFDLAAATNIKLDLDDRPQKAPRACVIASDPPSVVHLITRAQGGLHDYQAFLHEAGHALHYGGVDSDLPYTFRRISRDHALTEIYSYIVEAISREPGWHARYFGLSDEQAAENAEATIFLEALLFRRYEAKLRYELGFWSRFPEDGGTPEGYEEFLTAATGIRYRSDQLPLRHGRRLLLGRLPASVDPLRPAPPPPDPDGRRGLVAQPGHRRAPAPSSSPRARSRRARRSPGASASTRWTRPRCWPRSAPEQARAGRRFATLADLARPIRLVA